MNNNDYQILDSVPVSIYWKDLNGMYLGCNKYMLQMAGLDDRTQILGKTDYELPWKNQADKICQIDQLVIKNNRTYEIEEHPKTSDNSIRSFLSTKTPFVDEDGKILGIIGISIDITEKTQIGEVLKNTEATLTKSLSIKERFLKNISHEIRNPLQAFVVTAETLAEDWDNLSDETRLESVKFIASSARRLSNIVINTFDLSDLINQTNQVNFKNTNLNDLVTKAANSFNAIRFSKQQPEIIVKSSQIFNLVLDEEKIYQVMNHLLLNATKWTSVDKFVTIELSESKLPDSSIRGIKCSVKDQGIRIPDNELEFIFEPFAESSNTASKACGVGLGLALCREILKVHMGTIWAENNTKGNGVTVSFIIPTFLSEQN